jgi:benzoyl-CoA reductase/2-hydroxyglutaryl-CoA dehydratase subunit BcrC/BadD/HgdB
MNDNKKLNCYNAKASEKQRAEIAAELDRLAARGDYRPDLAYFLDLFRDGSSLSAVAQRVGRPMAAILCVQTPLELFHAFGFHPYKIFSGSHAAGQTAAHYLPALTCPMLRSALGALELGTQEPGAPDMEAANGCPWIIPTTCDWVVKFSEMARLSGNVSPKAIHWMELPRLKDSLRARDRWFSEVAALRDFLSRSSGRVFSRRALTQSIETFNEARQCFSRLLALRRAGFVPAPWFLLIASSFFLDSVENWTAALGKALPGFSQKKAEGRRIFLAGSPIFFPDFKLPRLLEEAGLLVTGDDHCSSERIFPPSVAVSDTSSEGLLRALAESYHQGCLCPAFGDNERRINNIWEALPDAGFAGLVFHVLKGCHPYDLESFALEEPLKKGGLRFLRIETDYAAEDSQNILTRLEAFSRTLGD